MENPNTPAAPAPAEVISDAPMVIDQGALDAAIENLVGKPAEPAKPPVVEAKVEAAPVVEPTEPTKPTLVEVAKAERERRLVEVQRERDEYQKKLVDLQSAQPKPADGPKGPLSLADLRKLYREDPDKVAQAMGFADAAKMAKFGYAKKLGADSKIDVSLDSEILSVKEQLEAQAAELASLRSEREKFENQEKERRTWEERKASLGTFVEAHVDSMPATKAFLGAQREVTLHTMALLVDELRAQDPHVGQAAVAEEFERRMSALAPKKLKELEGEAALWRAAAGISAPVETKTSTPVSPAKTLTSATAAGSTTPSSAPKTEDERLADAVRYWDEEVRKSQAEL